MLGSQSRGISSLLATSHNELTLSDLQLRLVDPKSN